MSNSDDSSPEGYILDESSDPDGHLALGLSLEGGSDFEGAIEALSRAIDSNPQNVFAYYHRGYCYSQTHALQQAIDDFSSIIRIDPNDSTAYVNRATIYYDLEEYDEAWGDLETAVELNPNDPVAHHLRGDLSLLGGELDQAVGCYETALSLDPDLDDARINRMKAYHAGKIWWIFDRRGIYLGNITKGATGDYSAQVGKDSVNQRYDDMVSVFQAMGKGRIDHENSVIFTAVDLEEAVDAIAELGLILTENQDGPPWDWIAWLDSIDPTTI